MAVLSRIGRALLRTVDIVSVFAVGTLVEVQSRGHTVVQVLRVAGVERSQIVSITALLADIFVDIEGSTVFNSGWRAGGGTTGEVKIFRANVAFV